MSDVSGQTTYGYDPRNRLTSKQTPFGTLSYTYDNAGDVATIASSNTNGALLTYAYDALNRLSTVTDNRLVAQGSTSGVTHYSYDPVSNLSGYTYPNGVQTSYSYDGLNRLTQMGSAKSGALSSYAYTLGAAGNRLTVAELSGRNVAYGYDALYRLTSEAVTADPHNHNVTNGYLYDAVGNRQQWLVDGATVNTYTYDADDRLGADTYDANGNTVRSTGVSDSYDFENHLVQKGAVTLVYDGDGNRVAETVGGVTTNYLVDTQNPTGYAQVVDELQSSTVTRTYAYGLERIDENQTISGTWTASFYGYDGHGSVRQLTNSAGVVTDTYDYDAFGNLSNSTGTTPNNYLFAGEAYDSALGLYYNRARYLNTATGRFWSMDKYEGDRQSPSSLHKYLYASANPVNRSDRSGHEDADIGSFSVANAVNQTIQGISTLVTSAARITVIRLLTVGAALGSSIFARPGVQEELENGGAEAIAAAQNAFFEYEGVVTEAEAETSSIWTNYPALRQYLNQLFTRLPGANPPGIEYHHIVEQSQEAASGFAENAINSMSNVVPTPSAAHQVISDFYQSSPEWLEGLSVRQWMATQSWEVQWKAGLEIWKEAMTGGINWHPPGI